MATSIVDISVKDEAFKEFYSLFEKYRASLTKLPGAWGATNAEAKKLAKNFEGIAGFMTGPMVAQSKKSLTVQQGIAKATSATATSMMKTAKSSAVVAKNILGATRSLAKWAGIAGIFTGLLGTGGLFGLGSLARNVSNDRRGAAGINTTSGQAKAFATNYSRFVDPNSYLSNVNDALQDQSKRNTLYRAGLTEAQIKGKNTTQVGQMLIPLLRQKFLQFGGTTQGMHAAGIDQFIGLQDANRLRAASPEELAKADANTTRDTASMSLSKTTQDKWQDFSTQLDRAGAQIETVFVKGLTPLIVPFTHLSDSITKALTSLLGNPALPGYIDDMGKGIERFAKYVNSPEAIADMNSLLSNIVKVGAGLGRMAETLAWLFPDKQDANHPISGNTGRGVTDSLGRRASDKLDQSIADMGFNPFTFTDKDNPKRNFYALEKANGLPFGLLDRTWRQESGRGGADTPDSDKGAKGPMQFMDPTAAQYGLHGDDVRDLTKASAASARFYADLKKHFQSKGMAGQDLTDAMTAGYNAGQGTVDKDMRLHPNDWRSYLLAETRDYVRDVGGGNQIRGAGPTPEDLGLLGPRAANAGGLTYVSGGGMNSGANPQAYVVIQNQTGGSAVITTHQLVH